MDQATLEALLGRPLTPTEVDNLELYVNIATEALEDLICTTIANTTETRTFDLREGYSTAFVDLFRSVTEVKVDGVVKDAGDYSKRQWDKRTATWYNSLVFKCRFGRCDKEITVTGQWGFETVPSDLQAVLAGLFDLVTKKNKQDASISSKQVEDFRISFNADSDLDEEFSSKYAKTISKYSLCDIPYVLHGEVCEWNRY